MTDPGDPMAMIPTIQAIAMARDLRAALRVLCVFDLGDMSCARLLEELDNLVDDLEDLGS